MAITRSSLTGNADTTNATSYTTASITPTANRLIVACYTSVNLTEAVDPSTPTVTGNGLTWSVVDAFLFRNYGDRGKVNVCAADTGASPSSGGVTFSHASQTQEAAAWSVFELNGTDLASSGGSSTVADCFVQFVHSAVNASGTSISLTLGAAGATDNRPFLMVTHWAAEATAPDADWTEIHDYNTAFTGNDGGNIETQERLSAFDTTASATWTSSVAYGGTAFEIKALAAGGGGGPLDPMGMSGFFGA